MDLFISGFKVSDVDPRAAGCNHQLSLMAIAVCIGVVLLGFIIIVVFLICRRRRCSTSSVAKDSNIRFPQANERTLYRDPTSELVPIPTPVFSPKYNLPQHTPATFPQCLPDNNHQQCLPGCQTIRSQGGPYSVHPATHPLLTPTSPSPISQSQVPGDWLCPNPYEDDTLHWYTTIGRDGREYLTGIAGELTFIPPPPPVTLPPELPPSPPISIRLQRNPSTVSQPSPKVLSRWKNTGESPENNIYKIKNINHISPPDEKTLNTELSKSRSPKIGPPNITNSTEDKNWSPLSRIVPTTEPMMYI